MSDLRVVTKVDTKRLEKMFRRLEGNISPSGRAKIFGAVAQDMASAVDKNFETQGSRLPGGWEPWARSTMRRKEKRGRNKILQDSGQLRNSINTRHSQNYAAVGTNKVYGPIHQRGGTINHPGGTPYLPIFGPAGRSGGASSIGVRFLKKDGQYPNGTKFTKPHPIKIPARPFLALNARDIDQIELTIGNSLVKGTKR